MHLKIKISDDCLDNSNSLIELYHNHQHFHEGDAGLDLYMPNSILIPGGARGIQVSLEIACEAFNNKNKESHVSYYLYPRSSISKTPLRMSNSVGIIDAGYRGNLIVSLDNLSTESYQINRGTRLFQLCGPSLEPNSFQLSNELSDTSRGGGGFGSTGQ